VISPIIEVLPVPDRVRIPRIGVLPGHATGVRPELTAKLLARPDVRERAAFLILDDPAVWAEAQDIVGVSIDMSIADDFARRPDAEAGEISIYRCGIHLPGSYTVGRRSLAAGAAVMDMLTKAVAALTGGYVDGLLFAPLNKQAMKRAGPNCDDETQFLAQLMGHRGPAIEFNVLDNFWTARVTSHMPLRNVASEITAERIERVVKLIHDTPVRAGNRKPRIKVARLNPHAGEGGLLGREEAEIIGPAMEDLQRAGIDVGGRSRLTFWSLTATASTGS